MFADCEFEKKRLKCRIFQTSHDVDQKLNCKNLTLDLVLIHHSHHTFKNASCSDVAFEVFAEQGIRLKKFFFAFTLLHLATRKIALIVDLDRPQKLNLTFPVQIPHPTQAILKCPSPLSKVMAKCLGGC